MSNSFMRLAQSFLLLSQSVFETYFLVAYHSNRCLVLCQFLGWLYGALLNSKICPWQAGLTDCNGMWRQRKWGGLQSKSAMAMPALAATFQHWNIFGNQNAVGTWILESGWKQKNNICWSVWCNAVQRTVFLNCESGGVFSWQKVLFIK